MHLLLSLMEHSPPYSMISLERCRDEISPACMRVHVCRSTKCACVHVCMRACVYACMCVCVHVCRYVCACMHVFYVYASNQHANTQTPVRPSKYTTHPWKSAGVAGGPSPPAAVAPPAACALPAPCSSSRTASGRAPDEAILEDAGSEDFFDDTCSNECALAEELLSL